MDSLSSITETKVVDGTSYPKTNIHTILPIDKRKKIIRDSGNGKKNNKQLIEKELQPGINYG